MYVYLSISLYLYNYDYPGAQEASLREPSFAYISGCLGKIMLLFFLVATMCPAANGSRLCTTLTIDHKNTWRQCIVKQHNVS